jgi:hypothetical protein
MKSRRIQSCVVFAAFGRMLLGLALMIALTLPARAEKASSADAFVDSVGINIHLHNQDTPYSNFPRVRQSLRDLGIRHVRDGLIDTTWKEYYDRHNELGRSGIKGTFITSPDQNEQLLLDYPLRMNDSFEAYEAPNEYDQSRDPNWVTTLPGFLSKLNNAIKADSRASHFPIVGPSLTRPDSYEKLRGVCSFDYANLHDYFAGRNPGTTGWGANGYGSISWNLSNVSIACPDKPVITTETGYQTDTALTQGVPEEVAAKYVLRVFLEQRRRGIQRTYLYELIDLPSGRATGDSRFGLLRPDYSAKPAYTALMNLLHLLADPGPSYTGAQFNFVLTGDLSNVHHVLLQKRSGSFYLALWVEEPCYDVDSKKAIPVPDHHIVVQSDDEVTMTWHSFGKSGVMQTTSLGASTTHAVEVSDSVTVLEIDNRPAPPVLLPPVVR